MQAPLPQTRPASPGKGDIFQQVDHRPWPLPSRIWALRMRWHDLAFLHWPVPPQWLRPLVPPGLELDTFDGHAWLGIIPFHMTGVRVRATPCRFAFAELNLRTYVRSPGRSGVWFFSLDATNRLAVRAARLWYRLPYFDAQIRVASDEAGMLYHSRRTHRRSPPAEFHAHIRPTGPICPPEPGTLEHWLTERYCLYCRLRAERLGCSDVHHPRWPLQPAEAEIEINTMADQLGLELPRVEPVVHFSRLLDAVSWSVQRLKQPEEVRSPIPLIGEPQVA